MDPIKTIVDKYNHDDMLTTIALLAIIFFAWRATSVDLDHFGEGILAIFGGHGVRSWGNSKEESAQ